MKLLVLMFFLFALRKARCASLLPGGGAEEDFLGSSTFLSRRLQSHGGYSSSGLARTGFWSLSHVRPSRTVSGRQADLGVVPEAVLSVADDG